MSTTTTRRMLKAYTQRPVATRFLSSLFQSPPENFHSTEEVEIDIERSGEEVAVVIQNLHGDYRMNSEDEYSNKSFVPPIFKEAFPLRSADLLKRLPGDNPFKNPEFRSSLMLRVFSGMRKVEDKIRRAVEYQASQVLQTAKLDLKDAAGVSLYTLDFAPKITHFPTVSVPWATATGAQMLSDIEASAEVNRSDGLTTSNKLIFGTAAYNKFTSNTTIQALLDNRRMSVGQIVSMEQRDNGGTYRGTIQIGNYSFEIWTYSGRYIDPVSRAITPYLHPGKIIVMSDDSRLDATFGAIPNIGRELGVVGPSILPELPSRMSNAAGGMDLFTNVWTSANGETLYGGVGARPLMIPTAIDTYSCINTQLT